MNPRDVVITILGFCVGWLITSIVIERFYKDFVPMILLCIVFFIITMNNIDRKRGEI